MMHPSMKPAASRAGKRKHNSAGGPSAAKRGRTERKAAEHSEKALKPRDLIGARVQKRFPGYGTFTGTVQRRASRDGHFDVLWNDGDTTTMTAQAIATHLC